MDAAEQYYELFEKSGIDVLIDDRDESPGRKFKDSDLIGIPIKVVIGKRILAQNKIEIKNRRTGETLEIDRDAVLSKIQEMVK